MDGWMDGWMDVALHSNTAIRCHYGYLMNKLKLLDA
jgi:hypothetical protein